jgi:hypothetical protein
MLYSFAQKIVFLNFPVPNGIAGSLSYNIIFSFDSLISSLFFLSFQNDFVFMSLADRIYLSNTGKKDQNRSLRNYKTGNPLRKYLGTICEKR